jgi:mono/diheme cytochrome c family protein
VTQRRSRGPITFASFTAGTANHSVRDNDGRFLKLANLTRVPTSQSRGQAMRSISSRTRDLTNRRSRPLRTAALVLAVGALAGLVLLLSSRSERSVATEWGARLYREQSCANCHGADGRGDGSRANTLDPPPRDFRDPLAFVQGTTARDVAATLETGVTVRPSQMPSFAHLSESERLVLGEFIVSLRQKHLEQQTRPRSH